MNLSENEVKENYNFYKTNYSKLLKINKIISNIKFANIYNLTPQEVLAKLVPESELKNMKVPGYDAEQEEKDKYNEAPICPEYTLPPTWEELFTLKNSNKVINKLYIQSEIERVSKNHADWKKESLEKWENIINENNYKDYDKDYEEQTGKLKIKTETKDKNIVMKEIKSLEYFKVNENEIKNNIDYYTKNIDELKKINTIICKAKEGGIYDLTIQEAIKKVFPDNPNHIQGKWEDLFNLQTPKYKTDFLMKLTEKNIYWEKTKKEIKKEMEKEEKDKKKNLIDAIFDKAKEGNLIKKSNPREIMSKINGCVKDYIPDEWKELHEYNLENYILEMLLKAIEIEILKNKYSKTDKKKNYDYYDELIGVDNYEKYKTYYNEFNNKYNYLEKINKTIRYIENNDSYISEDDVKEIKDFKKLTFDCLSEDLNILTIFGYDDKFTKIKEKIEKKKNMNRKNNDYNNYNSNNNSSYNSGSSNNSGSSKKDDRKKCNLILCQNCKNTCIGCRKKLKGGEGIGKGFHIHKKCQTSSCYFCGKASDIKERETVYLCKSCYNSKKFDWSLCVDCHKSFN